MQHCARDRVDLRNSKGGDQRSRKRHRAAAHDQAVNLDNSSAYGLPNFRTAMLEISTGSVTPLGSGLFACIAKPAGLPILATCLRRLSSASPPSPLSSVMGQTGSTRSSTERFRCPAVWLLFRFAAAAPVSAYGQLTPPAGSAGAGNSPISGVPFDPANPRVVSDPSGIGNASSVPRLGRNPLTPVVSSTPSGSSPRVVALYAGASQRIISANQVHSRKPRGHGHHPGRPQVSKFTGICRGC